LSNKQDKWDPDWQSTSSSKVAYLVQRLKALQGTNEDMSSYTDNSNNEMHIENSFPLHTGHAESSFQECSTSSINTNVVPEKVLIFSQFLEHIHVIEQQVLFFITCDHL
jgi:SNF2 family DNA or RNA helicase